MRLALVCSALLVVALAGCGKDDKPNPNPAPTPNPNPGDPKVPTPGPSDPKPPTAGEDLTKAKPDVTMTADEWKAEFAKDAQATHAKYATKVIELRGVVHDVGIDFIDDVPLIRLKTGKEWVRCVVGDDQEYWEKLAPGSEVTLRGRIPQYGIIGELKQTVIIKAGPNPAKSITAPELAKEFNADKKAAETKWNKQWVYLEGELATAKKAENGQWTLIIRGEGECDIEWYMPVYRDKVKSELLKPGQKVKILGNLLISIRSKQEISLQQSADFRSK